MQERRAKPSIFLNVDVDDDDDGPLIECNINLICNVVAESIRVCLSASYM